MLLEYGADKYLVAKLSVTNMKRLNQKSLSMLRRWQLIHDSLVANTPTPSPSASDANAKRQQLVVANKNVSDQPADSNFNEGAAKPSVEKDLKPFSPLMASLCLDDVDIFARLHKHHRQLFSYFRPHDDYELIYFAIRCQSTNCLAYLLSNINTTPACTKNR